MKTKHSIPRTYQGPTQPAQRGLLIVYTGEGKGKTTAAFGAVLRSLGRGYRVAIVQFIKGKWVSGEIKALEKFSSQVAYASVGEGFTWETKSLKKDKAIARKGWRISRSLLRHKKYHLYLFDEILYVLKYRLLPIQEVVKALQRRDPKAHVILTGRDAPPSIIRLADLVTEMREVKHPFRRGFLAQPGLDY